MSPNHRSGWIKLISLFGHSDGHVLLTKGMSLMNCELQIGVAGYVYQLICHSVSLMEIPALQWKVSTL